MWRRLLLVALVAFSLGGAQKPQPQGQTEKSETTQLQSSAASIAQAVREMRPEKDLGCQDRRDDRSSDLCAQWKAADAAKQAALATWAAVFFSFVGTYLIYRTFIEQRKTSRAELRAYIAVKGRHLRLDHDTGKVRAEMQILNTGKTPAFNTHWGGKAAVGSREVAAAYHPGGRVPPGPSPEATTFLTIHAGSDVHGDFEDTLGADAFVPVAQGKAFLYVIGTVWYEDAFGQPRYTNFCLEMDSVPKQAPPGQFKYEITPFHNDSD